MLHPELTNDPVDATKHHLHGAGYMVSDVNAMNAITTMQEKDLALVTSPPSIYMYVTLLGVGAWYLVGSAVNPWDVVNPLVETNGQDILWGQTPVNISGAASCPLTAPTVEGCKGKIVNLGDSDLTITAPAGWNFQDAEDVVVLGPWASVDISYLGGQVILYSKNTGRP